MSKRRRSSGFQLDCITNVTSEHKREGAEMLFYAGVYFCHFVREKLQPWGHWSCTELPKTLTCKLPSLERVILLVHEKSGKNQTSFFLVPCLGAVLS